MPKELIDDELWSLIEPLLPARAPRNRQYAGRKPTPDRAVLTGIVFVLRWGIAWNLLPQEMGCGSGTACWRRLVAWQETGGWQHIHETFKTGMPAKKVTKAARQHSYVFCYMPDGVLTYAADGHLASGPTVGVNDDETLAVAVRQNPPSIELAKYAWVSIPFEQALIKALDAETVTRCKFMEWMSTEAVRLSYYDSIKGTQVILAISRELMIKRVANTWDGSHPSVASDADIDNTFDAPIRHLLQFKVAGLPLPYYLLLKVARDILDVGQRLLYPKAPTT
jgi:transposase